MTILNRPDPDRGREPRRWTVPPAPTPTAGPFEGARVLEEVRPASLASLLWHSLRAVQLWTAVQFSERRGLFSALPSGAADAAAEEAATDITVPLRTFCRLIEAPELSDAPSLAEACREISGWAAGLGFPATECEFAEADAYLLPDSADAALFAGRAARRTGALQRAQTWYHRASGLARRAGDKQAFVLSLIRRGTLAEELGDTDKAKRMHYRAWKAATRYKLDKLGAYAQHELLVIAVHSGSLEEGQHHALTAIRLYGRFDNRFPQLAHDTAFLWAWHGYHAAAMPVYQAVLPYIVRPGERIQVIANIGRAHAATGDANGFFKAWNDVERCQGEAGEHTATALLNLAMGASTLGLKLQALDLAKRGLEHARARSQGTVSQRLETLIKDIALGAAKDVNRPATEEMGGLAARLTSRLRRGTQAR